MADLSRPFLVFYITHPDEATASRIVSSLITDKLIACGNIFPVQSTYEWDGTPVRAGEWVSVLKTGLDREYDVENAIIGMHPYEVPCIVRYEVRANQSYADWIEACTSR
ncbi:MAG: divalent-cation tolerance protein CutA [Bacteroidota bacterium]